MQKVSGVQAVLPGTLGRYPTVQKSSMPTTFRFLARLTVLGALAAAAIYALATYVEPTPEPVSVRIAPERLQP